MSLNIKCVIAVKKIFNFSNTFNFNAVALNGTVAYFDPNNPKIYCVGKEWKEQTDKALTNTWKMFANMEIRCACSGQRIQEVQS